MTTKKLDKISDIPRNPNSIEIGLSDPTPERDPTYAGWRALISWLKGWGSQ